MLHDPSGYVPHSGSSAQGVGVFYWAMRDPLRTSEHRNDTTNLCLKRRHSCNFCIREWMEKKQFKTLTTLLQTRDNLLLSLAWNS